MSRLSELCAGAEDSWELVAGLFKAPASVDLLSCKRAEAGGQPAAASRVRTGIKQERLPEKEGGTLCTEKHETQKSLSPES